MPGLARRWPRVAVIGELGYALPAHQPPPPSPEERSMIAYRAAIASLAIACATEAGCRAPGIAPMRTEPGGPAATGEILEPPLPCVRPEKTFTITFATFIPANHLVAPSFHPQSYGRFVPPMRLAFAGDDRGFDVD